jgi:arabinogalactan endo-1,4-beta-galactosidase
MKMSDAFPSRYLRPADLQGNQVTLAMLKVEMEKVGDDDLPILYFENKSKGMVLNKTNANTIALAFGDDTENWQGGEIILFETIVDFQGKSMPAIRCRIPPRKPKPKAPEIEDDIPF